MDRGAIVGWEWDATGGCDVGRGAQLQAPSPKLQAPAPRAAGLLGRGQLAAQSSAQMWEITRLTDHEITSPGLICPSFLVKSLGILLVLL